MELNLQLVYVYIESSYSEIGGIELQLSNGTEIYFQAKTSKDYLVKYCFAKKDTEPVRCADTFFDPKGRLKRLDVLVGENGTGKSTILNTIAGIGNIGSWIELYYSCKEDKYYCFSGENHYISINAHNPEIEICLDESKLEELDSKYRKVYIHTNKYHPEFLWCSTEEQNNKRIMECDYKSVGKYLFSRTFKKHHSELPYSFTFQIDILVKEAKIFKTIKMKQNFIHYMNCGEIYAALDILKKIMTVSWVNINTYTNYAASRENFHEKMSMIEKAFKDLIVCLKRMSDTNGVSVVTQMRYNEAGEATVADPEQKLNWINMEVTINWGDPENKDLMLEFFEIMDVLNKNTRYSYSRVPLMPFQCGFRAMSTGELAYLKLYAEINSVLVQHADEPGLLLFLLDEPEAYMHPEWSRKMIANLVTKITELYDANQNWIANCQLMITTHTPYLLSDLLPCFITCLQLEQETIHIYKGSNSFAANLYDILNSNFFVSNPIGDFALSKLDHILKAKTGQDAEVQDGSSENISDRELIEWIGDEYLKMQLKRIWKERS